MTVENGRKLKPTNLGIVLVHGYYKTGPHAASARALDGFIATSQHPLRPLCQLMVMFK